MLKNQRKVSFYNTFSKWTKIKKNSENLQIWRVLGKMKLAVNKPYQTYSVILNDVWKSQKNVSFYHSSLKMHKIINDGEFLKTWSLRSKSATRQVQSGHTYHKFLTWTRGKRINWIILDCDFDQSCFNLISSLLDSGCTHITWHHQILN